jgi:hypothetical protein
MNEEKSCVAAVAWNGYKIGMEFFLLAFVYLLKRNKSFLFLIVYLILYLIRFHSHHLYQNSSSRTDRGRDPIMTLLNFIGFFMQSASDVEEQIEKPMNRNIFNVNSKLFAQHAIVIPINRCLFFFCLSPTCFIYSKSKSS